MNMRFDNWLEAINYGRKSAGYTTFFTESPPVGTTLIRDKSGRIAATVSVWDCEDAHPFLVRVSKR